MLEEVLRTIRDYFIRAVWKGKFYIENGSLADVDFILENQYYRISGSVFNDGIHKFGDAEDPLTDEVFDGEVWVLAIPLPVLSLCNDIEAWVAKYGTVDSQAMSPFNSESFGGYSYSKSSGGGSGSSGGSASNPSSWQAVFAPRLNPWRKMIYESPIRSYDYVRHT